MLFARLSLNSEQNGNHFVKEVITQSADQDEQEFYGQMIDTLLKAVYASNNGYTVWLCFDDDTPFPTLDDTKKIAELTRDFIKAKGAKPLASSTPDIYGNGEPKGVKKKAG
jgi:hypothetical protein